MAATGPREDPVVLALLERYSVPPFAGVATRVYPFERSPAREKRGRVAATERMTGSLEHVAALAGHSERAWYVSWRFDGKLLASCSGDRTVRLWAVNSAGAWTCAGILEDAQGRTIRACEWYVVLLQNLLRCVCVCVSACVCASLWMCVCVCVDRCEWESSQDVGARLNSMFDDHLHVWLLSRSPDGRYLASVSFDATTVIWEKRESSYEVVASLEGHESEVKSVAWSTSGSYIATCSRDKSIWIWEADADTDFECISVLHGHTQDVKFVTWHPTQDLLVSTSYDNTIRVWAENEDDWYCKETLTGHEATVWGVAFNAEGTEMASVSDDNDVMLWHYDCNSKETDEDGRCVCQSYCDSWISRAQCLTRFLPSQLEAVATNLHAFQLPRAHRL